MRFVLPALFSMFIALSAAHAAEPLRLGVVAPDHENLADAEILGKYHALGEQLSAQLKTPVSLSPVYSPFTAMKRVSRGEYDIILAPAHVIAVALKANYAPVAKTSNKTGAVFVVAADAPWQTLEQAKGARLGLSASDSLPASLARGEINSKSLEMRKQFSEVRYFRRPEAVLYSIQIKATDIAAADAGLAQTWLKTNKGRILQKTAEVPLLALAVKRDRIDPDKDGAILNALAKFSGSQTDGQQKMAFVAAQREEFAAVASTLNTTPKDLPGARVIDAQQAAALQNQGVVVIDARNAEEYANGHIKGSVWVPYAEVSAKEVGFNPAEDRFDLSKLPQDKGTRIALYCDGTPCWKSYKASTLAIRNGYRNVYWFRGGFPEWKAAGMPIESGK